MAELSVLTLFHREVSDIAELLLSQDVIYVGGGNTANMLAIWRLHGVDGVLREAWSRGIVLGHGRRSVNSTPAKSQTCVTRSSKRSVGIVIGVAPRSPRRGLTPSLL